MAGKIAVLIDAQLHNELVLRTRSSDDVSHYVEHALEGFLERTKHEEFWSHEWYEQMLDETADDKIAQYGDPNKGFNWGPVFIPNGSQLRMHYKGRNHHAEIRHGKLMEGEVEYSPSEWASKVANNTSRNAWRDIEIQPSGTNNWILADVLRREQKERQK